MRPFCVFGFFGFLIVNICGQALSPSSESQFIWQNTKEWSTCSQTCGSGIQQQKLICIEKSHYSETIVSEEKCKNSTRLLTQSRVCNFGDCQNKYFWRPGKWSECSQTCGNTGRKTRDVECTVQDGSNNYVKVENKLCNSSFKPETLSSCNVVDCPFLIVPGEWGECIRKANKCVPGIQRRKLVCTSITKTGQPQYLDRFACVGKTKPPISWRKCDDHLKKKECLQSLSNQPVIETKFNTLVQMRKTKNLNVAIGQLAYVLLFTKITISCPVKNFVPREIEWRHGDISYKYQGRSKDHIKVDKNGRLRIKKLQVGDQGIWTCIAGQSNATTIIKVRNPSVGFHDWMLRRALWIQEMMNEDPGDGLRPQEIVQWIKKGWTQCSVTCGGEGTQSREVHCEQLDTRHYNILNDDVCEKRGFKKPLTIRSCEMSKLCPQWSLTKYEPNTCTDKCLKVGFGKIKTDLQCIHNGKTMDSNACNKNEMPNIECPNDKCQVVWKTSNWSKCSRSCGGFGIVARYVICIWQNSEEPAGSLCYNEKIPLPQVLKSCQAPKCNLKCVDLYPNCKTKSKYCKLSMYRHLCCKTCSEGSSTAPTKVSESTDSNVKSKSIRSNVPSAKRTNSVQYNKIKNQIENKN